MSKKHKKQEKKEPRFPFDKIPFQEKHEKLLDIEYDDLDSHEKLDLGESELRQRRRLLREERDAGHEP